MFSKQFISSVFFLATAWLQNGLAQTMALYDVTLANLLLLQRGLGWPHELHVIEGHEALLKLSNDLVNQQSCVVTTPSGITFNVREPPKDRYESWSDGCGVRVRDVLKSDEGRWRLTAIRGNDSITGWSEVYVQDGIPDYTGSSISLQDGQTNKQVELTTLHNTYCLVAQPFSESSLVPGHCRVTLDRTTRAVQGTWSVLLGLPGQVSELQIERRVDVETERLDAGYVSDTNTKKLHLYCNILHTSKNITFCRFQKTTESVGYNVMDGLSDGVHSYYGDGFANRHCGMTVESPTAQAFGTWRCTVGVQEWVGNQIQQKTPMQALIRVASFHLDSSIRRNLQRDDGEAKTLFVQQDMSFTINCRADVSLSYCWFQHPNGSQYTPVPHVDDDQEFWYTGESLQTGHCGITFTHATEDKAGEWTCHMGPRNQLGVEITDRLNVRVTGPLAANMKEVTAVVGKIATLHCHSSNGNRPLEYCRFLTPSFVGISLDSSVTKENAILDRYYFSPGKDLNHGDCSLTIDPVVEEDVGGWTCAALLDDETLESRDTITLYVETSALPRFRADIMGITTGVAVLLVVLGGVLWFKRDKLRWPSTGNSQRSDNISLEMRFDQASTRTSQDSGSSGYSLERE